MESESTRQQKVARQIQKDLAEIIRARGMSAYDGAMLTVSGVKITSDLALAKVYEAFSPPPRRRRSCSGSEKRLPGCAGNWDAG